MNLKEIGVGTQKCVNLVEDRDYWRDLVNAALNFLVPYTIELNLYFFDGVVIAVQCTATFSDLLCSRKFRYY